MQDNRNLSRIPDCPFSKVKGGGGGGGGVAMRYVKSFFRSDYSFLLLAFCLSFCFSFFSFYSVVLIFPPFSCKRNDGQQQEGSEAFKRTQLYSRMLKTAPMTVLYPTAYPSNKTLFNYSSLFYISPFIFLSSSLFERFFSKAKVMVIFDICPSHTFDPKCPSKNGYNLA